jgi:hypothetical protein
VRIHQEDSPEGFVARAAADFPSGPDEESS